MGTQKIENVVAHSSTGWNMRILHSQAVAVTNFSSIGSKSVGIAVDHSSNINFLEAYIFDVSERQHVKEEYLGGFLVCIYSKPYSGSPCQNVIVRNSIAAGCVGAGFVAPGHQCDTNGQDQTTFKTNVAHSIKGSGHIIYPNPLEISQQKNCFLVNHVQAYKNQGAGIVGQFGTTEYKVQNVILVDNTLGLSV